MKNRSANLAVVLMTALFMPLTACAADVAGKRGAEMSDIKYSIAFKKDGGFVVRDAQGAVVEPRRLNLPAEPLPVTAIVDVNAVVEAKGSCIVIINGFWYRIC